MKNIFCCLIAALALGAISAKAQTSAQIINGYWVSQNHGALNSLFTNAINQGSVDPLALAAAKTYFSVVAPDDSKAQTAILLLRARAQVRNKPNLVSALDAERAFLLANPVGPLSGPQQAQSFSLWHSDSPSSFPNIEEALSYATELGST